MKVPGRGTVVIGSDHVGSDMPVMGLAQSTFLVSDDDESRITYRHLEDHCINTSLHSCSLSPVDVPSASFITDIAVAA